MRQLWLVFVLAIGAVFAEKDHVIVVDLNQVVEENLTKSASVIEISGVCKKDVYVTAGQVIVDGVIEGDLILACGTLQITGQVKGSVRGFCAQTLITGQVGKNITLVCSNFTSSPSSRLLGSSYLAGGSFDISGQIQGPVYVGASSIRLDGTFNSEVNLYAGDIWVGMNANMQNQLIYHSENRLAIHPQAKLAKQPINRSFQEKFFKRFDFFDKILIGSKVAGLLMNFVFTLLAGLFYYKIWPHALEKSAYFLKNHMSKCLVHGLLFLLVAPIVGLLLLITILGIPIAITLVLFSILGLYAAKIHTLNFLAIRLNAKFKKAKSVGFLFVGLSIAYFLIMPIPYVGVVISVITTLVGMGAALHSPRAKLHT